MLVVQKYRNVMIDDKYSKNYVVLILFLNKYFL